MLLLFISFSFLDYRLVKKNESPIFCMPISHIKDGGTIIYAGLGYQIIDWHQLIYQNEIASYKVGVEIRYFPFFKYWGFLSHNITPSIELDISDE